MRWLLASRGKLLRVLLGTYDRVQTDLMSAQLRPGMVLFDVGAHAGYFTLLAARRVGASGQVVAFEPEPHNVAMLRANVVLNKLGNVSVEAAAVAGREGTRRFGHGAGSGTGALAEAGELEVRAVTLDAYCGRSRLTPDAIKIDVEGGELEVLDGASALLRDARPLVFLSTHGEALHTECLRRLGALGYTLEPIGLHGVFARKA
jgi:FkbM family methyltransferase